MAETIADLLRASPFVLAPMEDVSDAAYRAMCRTVGATLCVTEFVRDDDMIARSVKARRKAGLSPDDRPTAIQIYGADPGKLARAAAAAEAMAPRFIDMNCGCWVPSVVAGGAGAAWLRDPAQMVQMAAMVVRAVATPVTIKTRIGWGPESHMPIIDLARRLEDVGVAALTIHCRTALAGHEGPADWTWAARAQAVVRIPVIVNGDIRSGDDAARALAETGCAGAMIGRAAITHPWIFREATARWRGERVAPPTIEERCAFFRDFTVRQIAMRGVVAGMGATRRHLSVLGELSRAQRTAVVTAASLDALDEALAMVIVQVTAASARSDGRGAPNGSDSSAACHAV